LIQEDLEAAMVDAVMVDANAVTVDAIVDATLDATVRIPFPAFTAGTDRFLAAVVAMMSLDNHGTCDHEYDSESIYLHDEVDHVQCQIISSVDRWH
jgi:hypothetical protein